ncbi:MAG: twin-arginine translocation signal domain-containing protein, partial [candidate division Zixibacteria bacterium]|nr:twin-arginine translocation signal domain-containing protein [candidate division Zixibacteria bacterium]NIS15473.1 twin-arginine translocation signal domain-containing protein [candidate division Zixibacteria bacterium]NIT51988.1 twin-arginine translocation signal domain-containing protein [candidate division Zixibacteria bacterium]NIU15331.1 twin-arginine translocation signal domain-containing protein [candidate division Zixibacteria bacterium]NIV07406.1 twin-arginine translocation signal d
MSSSFDKRKKLNRRSFFKKAAAIGLGAVAGGPSLLRSRQTSAQIAIPKEPVSRRPFGR